MGSEVADDLVQEAGRWEVFGLRLGGGGDHITSAKVGKRELT